MGPPAQDAELAFPRADRITIWPFWIPVAATLIVSTAISFDPGLGILSFVLGVLVVCGWGIGMIAATGLAAWKHTWRRAASLAAVFVCAGPAMWVSLFAGDYVHLLLALPYYVTKVTTSATASKPIYFHWPSPGLAPSFERNLVYDPLDDLAADVGKIKPSESNSDVSRTVRHLAGHFYLVDDLW